LKNQNREISLTQTADNRSQNVKKRHQISNCIFNSGKAMLIEIKINVMQNMILNNKFKQITEIIENTNGSVVAHSGMITSFKYGQNGSQVYRQVQQIWKVLVS
jgi:hypothetical protein